MLKYIYFLFLVIAGCSEYEIRNVKYPEIEVDPYDHNFRKVIVNEHSDVNILIKNTGDDTLNINSINLSDISNTFLIKAPSSADIEPGEELTILARYRPRFFESNSASIIIESNDQDEPEVVVDLVGAGSAPIIKITPDKFSFDPVELGCEDDLIINVENIGDINLEITDIEFMSTVPADFDIKDFQDHIRSLPIVLEPNESFELSLGYIPSDLLEDSGFISFHSNDPITPIAMAKQEGDGELGPPITEMFYQDHILDVDMLFVVDNSCSMGFNQDNLIDNFSSFINVFSSAGADYRIAFITTDDPEFVGKVYVDSSFPNPTRYATNLISSIGTSGSVTEQGIQQAYDATQPFADAGVGSSFLRTDARFVVIFISDEPDFTALVTPLELSYHLLGMKTSNDLIAAHAVAGDYPSGCSGNGRANFGEGYYDVVMNLGGSFISICSNNWGLDLDRVARRSVLPGRFEVSSIAIEESILVYVNGILSNDWYYEESTNSVIFSSPPDSGSEILISYSTWGC